MRYDEPDSFASEITLEGGDVTDGLVRRGDTVRRPRGAASDGVESLLVHLEGVGFDGAPRYLGLDNKGRDVLTFVASEVATRPWPAWVADDSRATSVARLVRQYDDAAMTLGVPEWAFELRPPELPGQPHSTADHPVFVAHLDITPENVVFRNGEAMALIDFDLARPATRAEEVANMLLWWAPWMPVDDREDALHGADPFRRAAIIVDAYGLDDASRSRLIDVSLNIADRSWWSMRHRAETLGGGWRRMWDEGVGDKILRRQKWLTANATALGDAVV